VVLLGAAIIANPKLAVRYGRNQVITKGGLIIARIKGVVLLVIAILLLMRVWDS